MAFQLHELDERLRVRSARGNCAGGREDDEMQELEMGMGRMETDDLLGE